MKVTKLKLKIPNKIKRFLPFVFVLVIVFVGLSIPAGQASAASGGWLMNTLNPWKLITELLVSIDNIILWFTSYILWMAAYLFDYTLKLTLDNSTFSSISAVDIGWKVSRDIVNIFFIFILLYIAIATILQVAGYGVKELLVKVIIIALLVNFSLVITKVVIDASNILAMEFYSQIGIDKNGDGVVEKPDISSVMMSGLKLTTVYDGKDLKDPVSGNDGISPFTIMVATLGGATLMIVTAFVFFAATILFIIRTVFLLFLMILSPLAFVAMVLPATRSHASKWWNSLFSQAFFAPAFMFMIYLVAKIISDDSFKAVISNSLGTDASASISKALIGKDPGSLGVIVNFIILIGLMIGSLIIASKMGAMGSKTVMDWGKKGRKWGQGYAGKISKRGAGFAAEKVLDEKSWMNQKMGGKISGAMRKIPIARSGLAKASSWREQQIKDKQKKYEKKYASYSDAGLNAIGVKTEKDKDGKDQIQGTVAKTLKTLGMNYTRGNAVKNVSDKRDTDKENKNRKKENIKKENKEYNEAKLRYNSSTWKDKSADEIKQELINIEVGLAGLTNISAEAMHNNPELKAEQEDINKRKAEYVGRRLDIEAHKKDKEKIRQIEENMERRTEADKIGERITKVESSPSREKSKPSS